MEVGRTNIRPSAVQLEGGLTLSYVEYGDPSGEAVILLHGFTDSSFSFSRLLPLLDPARVHAFAIDQRGHGDSERPARDYTVDTLADDVRRFLDAIGIAQAVVVGHSMGSLVARRFAELSPERVARLVLIGSSYTFATDAAEELRAAVRDLEDPVPEAFARDFQTSTGHVPLPEEFFERIVADSRKVPARVWRDALDAVLDFDDSGDLDSIVAPTLVLSGRLDPYFGPDQQHALVAAIANSRLIDYPETAHNPHWERPESVAYDLAAFLSESVRSTPVSNGRDMSATGTRTHSPSSCDLHVEAWGDGTPVVLVHGSLATAADEWPAQRPLAEKGFRLLAPDRRGYGRSPSADGEDFLRDARDVAALMGDGAHLVGHSYGALAVLVAAAQRPEATLSIALLEPAAFALAQHDPAAQQMVTEVRGMWHDQVSDGQWVVGFLKAVGSDPDEFPPEFLDAALPLVTAIRRGRPMWYPDLPLGALRRATFPKLVVSGGHSAGFDAICDDLAQRIGSDRAVIEGAGHEIQFTGKPINDTLLSLWNNANQEVSR